MMPIVILLLLVVAALLFAVSYSRTKYISDIGLSVLAAGLALRHALTFGVV